ncbi:adenylyl-sulfate kinase [Cohnella suwonensis]|uniref:Adenylyl-sulfate kinase n=1 Tax=Cohnella suwonensis TaxID=696072 RepID=A0ABW0LSQ1_9BACL
MRNGITLWFTGLSGAGKSTVSEAVEAILKQRNVKVERLDGDDLRHYLPSNLGFTKEDREKNVRLAAFIAKLLTRNGVIVLASFISPYRQMRENCRQEIGAMKEIYVKCPLQECIRRDVKGLYHKALSGEIQSFTGISDPYEEPLQPDLVLETDLETTEKSAARIIAYLERDGVIQ